MSVGLLARKQVELEPSPGNFQKLAELLEAINTGTVKGVAVRPPMQVITIVEILGISLSTYYRWINTDKNKRTMPIRLAFNSLALNLLKVEPEVLAEYFYGNISLEQLFAVKTKQSRPEDVIQSYQSLDERDKDAVLAWLLSDRANTVGKFSLQRRSKGTPDRVSSPIGVSHDTKSMATSMGEGLSPQVAARLKNLLITSREKHSRIANKQLSFHKIAEAGDVRLGTYNISAVQAAARGEIGETFGYRLFPPEWEAIAAICFIPTGWSDDHPIGLTDDTYRDNVPQLKRSLAENGEPRLV